MRNSIIAALVGLAIGTLGALGYSHYLGDGLALIQAQEALASANTTATKTSQDTQKFKGETDTMSAQIQQLSSENDQLKHQVDELNKKAVSVSPAPAPNPMAGMMKAAMAQQSQQKLLLLKSRLHLTPEQEAAVKAAMDEESKRGEEFASQMMQGGKIDPQALNNLPQIKSVEQTLNDILTPDQKTAYQQMQADDKNNAAEMMASVETNQSASLLQLTDTQKDQVYSALYQVQMDSQDPAWIKNNVTANSSNPLAILDIEAKAKSDALSKILTPQQMATYQQQAQSQLDMQKAMMQKFTPASATGASTPTIITTTPAP